MSHIFDALQRSEGERAGVDSPGAIEATELLRNAERRAASRWETAVRLKKTDVREITASDTAVGPLAAPLEVPKPQIPGSGVLSPSEKDQGIFSQFRTLDVALPAQ